MSELAEVATHLDEPLYVAVQQVELARAAALLRGDPLAAERLELLRGLIFREYQYADNCRLGNPMSRTESSEWAPGRPDDETVAALLADDGHARQCRRIALYPARLLEAVPRKRTIGWWIATDPEVRRKRRALGIAVPDDPLDTNELTGAHA